MSQCLPTGNSRGAGIYSWYCSGEGKNFLKSVGDCDVKVLEDCYIALVTISKTSLWRYEDMMMLGWSNFNMEDQDSTNLNNSKLSGKHWIGRVVRMTALIFTGDVVSSEYQGCQPDDLSISVNLFHKSHVVQYIPIIIHMFSWGFLLVVSTHILQGYITGSGKKHRMARIFHHHSWYICCYFCCYFLCWIDFRK